jgi:CSLREA domain-containing protein
MALTRGLLITIALLVLTTAPSARAQTFPVLLTVTKTADTNDGTCDDDCSLREAIAQANSDGQNDTIQFAPGVSGSIVLDGTLGGLNISGDMTIDGPGADVLSVSGNNAVRPFAVSSGVTTTIDKLSIINGNEVALTAGGGGIANFGTLALNSSTINGNQANSGGGIVNSGTLTLDSSTVSRNTATDRGGGILSDGNSTTVRNSKISGNNLVFARFVRARAAESRTTRA